jgi:hypothetical protein
MYKYIDTERERERESEKELRERERERACIVAEQAEASCERGARNRGANGRSIIRSKEYKKV